MSRLIDLSGQKFGEWLVIERAMNNKSGQAQWLCSCSCGSKKVVAGGHLRGGRSTNCGCQRLEKMRQANIINEAGNKYGKLTVVEIDTKPPRVDRHGIYWVCECDCGNTVSVFGDYLRNGSTSSCGCIVSKNEAKIAAMLVSHGVEFKTQQTFPDLKGVNGYSLRFDFGVYLDGELKYLIEYDGVQHFKHKGSGWNTEECLQKNIVNDDIKNKYCEKKQIPLIRIPYDKEYSIKDVVLFDFLKK